MNLHRIASTPTKVFFVMAGITVVAIFTVLNFTAHAQSDCGGYQQDGGGGCFDVGGQHSRADVVMTANPSAIQYGASSVLSWGASNATDRYPYESCTIDNGVGAVYNTGTKTVSPGVTTNYTIHCTHYQTFYVPCGNTNCDASYTEESSASARVTVSGTPSLAASCAVSPTSISTGGSATWSVTASGGNGIYTYSWSGTDGLSGSTVSVTKPYPTAGTKTGSVTVTSGGTSITQACGSGLSVADLTSPDLTASLVTPSSAIAGTPVTLSATISNPGTASTGATFTDLFQRATDSSGTGSTDIGTYANAALATNASNAATLSYTFPSAGTWYVRACADKSSAGSTGVITESDETNNCSSSWTAVTVAAAVVPTLSCTISPSSGFVTVSGSATYTASGASAPYTWTAPDGGSYGTGVTASRTFNSVGGPYAMTVSKAGYTSAVCLPNIIASAAPACTGSTATIAASSTRIQSGQADSITYTASGVNTSCTLSGPGITPTQVIPATSCSIPGNGGTVNIPANTITTQATYTITCDAITQQVIVNVVPKFQEF